jgi:hypothetical protein
MVAVDALRLHVVYFGAVMALAADVHVCLRVDLVRSNFPAGTAGEVVVWFRFVRHGGSSVVGEIVHGGCDRAKLAGGLVGVVDVHASGKRHCVVMFMNGL